MSVAVCRLVLATIAIISATAAFAASPERGPMPHLVDLYGDPLPEGAVARLGSVRLRHNDLKDFAILPDVKSAVTVGADFMVRWWDLHTGRQARAVRLPFINRSGKPAAHFPVFAVSPDGAAVAFGQEEQLIIFDARTGRVEQTFHRPKSSFHALTFSPDGTILAYASNENVLTLITRKTEVVREATLRPERVENEYLGLTISFSADGRRVAVCRSVEPDHDVRVLDVATLREVFKGIAATQSASLAPDGSRIAFCGMEGKGREASAVLQLHNIATGQVTTWKPTEGDRAWFTVDFSPDGKVVACWSRNGAWLVDANSGRTIDRLPEGDSFKFSATGRWLAIRDSYQLRIWDVAARRAIHDRPGLCSYAAWAISGDGNRLASAGNQTIGLWDLDTGQHRPSLQTPKDWDRFWNSPAMSFGNRGRTPSAIERIGVIRSWNDSTHESSRPVLLRGTDDPDTSFFSMMSPPYHFSPDGRLAAASAAPEQTGGLYRLAVWEASTGEVVHRHRVPFKKRPVVDAWLPGGSAVVVRGEDKTILVDSATGRIGPEFPKAAIGYSCSEDGRLLFSCLNGFFNLPIWEAVSGQPVVEIPTGKTGSLALGVSLSARAVVIDDGRFLRVNDLVTGKERGRWAIAIRDHDNTDDRPIFALQAIPNSQRVLTILRDGTALVWDLAAFPMPRLSDKHGDPELRAWWDELAEEDAAKAYAAGCKLTEAPAVDVVKFLRTRIRPAKAIDAEVVHKLIGDLDSATFAIREAAEKKLLQLGPPILPQMRKPPANLSAEASQRLGRLREQLSNPVPQPETLRVLRALAVLERVGTNDACKLVDELAGGPADAPETQAARSTRERMRQGWSTIR
ncbi:MAG TPA: WD40 repeat domain-containing protein [Gemmataceae bacterium]|jgi:WD40 repeat protein|nr:WD40 repeat domain-containing protein [Gemmataceae bacterium]